jgi:two-component system OmpR family response regulator
MSKKVLIIDDELDFCLLMKQFLERKAYEVELAYTLEDGIRKLQSYKPDMVFLDNNLPDGAGWDMVRTMISRFPGVRFNLISAFKNNKEPVLHAQVKVLEKPVTFSTLENCLA